MMNFNNTSDTLSNFLNKKRETISLNSKLYVLINLLQALRLIKDYGVVHMDLSPSNVLVNSNYIAQLIDFGQSYHVKICGKGNISIIQIIILAILFHSASLKNFHSTHLPTNPICFHSECQFYFQSLNRSHIFHLLKLLRV